MVFIGLYAKTEGATKYNNRWWNRCYNWKPWNNLLLVCVYQHCCSFCPLKLTAYMFVSLTIYTCRCHSRHTVHFGLTSRHMWDEGFVLHNISKNMEGRSMNLYCLLSTAGTCDIINCGVFMCGGLGEMRNVVLLGSCYKSKAIHIVNPRSDPLIPWTDFFSLWVETL